jgi:hypothetical protein
MTVGRPAATGQAAARLDLVFAGGGGHASCCRLLLLVVAPETEHLHDALLLLPAPGQRGGAGC